MLWFWERSAHRAPERAEPVDRRLDEARPRICRQPRRVLLLPPDITRMHSGAGRLIELFYHRLKDQAEVRVIPTLGPHCRTQAK